jgi:hypothetical protein
MAAKTGEVRPPRKAIASSRSACDAANRPLRARAGGRVGARICRPASVPVSSRRRSLSRADEMIVQSQEQVLRWAVPDADRLVLGDAALLGPSLPR